MFDTSAHFLLDDPVLSVRLRPNPRARRLTLRLSPGGDEAILTLPPGVGAAEARRFVERHAGWLRDALARAPRAVTVGAGTALPVDGAPVEVATVPGARRMPRIESGRLVVQGPGAPGPRIAAWLRMRARDRLVPLSQAYAATLGVPLRGVAFKDTRSRWGSCSAAGRINLSWRLAMAPVAVQDYVAAHEVAHLVEMNHQPAYWAVLRRLMPDYAERRRWLTRQGRGLHAFRFEEQEPG